MRLDNGIVAKLGPLRTICLGVIAFGLILIMFSSLSHTNCPTNDKLFRTAAAAGCVAGRRPNISNCLQPWDYDWDQKASKRLEGKGERCLILIRHGSYDLNTGKLTQLGREQADLTGYRLKQMNFSYDSITHSTLDRAVETAEIIRSRLNNALPLISDAMLVEGGPIPPNPTISYWSLPAANYIVDGPRMEKAFQKYFHRSSYTKSTFEILVGHGNIFRFFALRALQLSYDAWMRVFIAHASITILHIRSDGTVSMSRFGDAGHLPQEKVTF